MVRRGLLVALAALAALGCQGGRDERNAATGGPTPPPPPDDAAAAAEPDDAAPPEVPTDAAPEEPEPPDPGKVIAELGAISAWQAVVDRTELLARRGQRGVVYGRIGPPILMPGPPGATDAGVPIDAGLVPSPYVWLVDDTEGNGALGIRVALGAAHANQGDRVGLRGAWHLDEARRWYWKVESLQALPPGPASDIPDPPAPAPSHELRQGRPPPGTRPIALAKDHDAVYFQLVGPAPTREGDGWLVANELGDKPFARLILPGERPTYGGQDMRAPDERWRLERRHIYWVRIGKIRTRGPDEPVLIRARTAPVLVR